jgi:hypothetical protein
VAARLSLSFSPSLLPPQTSASILLWTNPQELRALAFPKKFVSQSTTRQLPTILINHCLCTRKPATTISVCQKQCHLSTTGDRAQWGMYFMSFGAAFSSKGRIFPASRASLINREAHISRSSSRSPSRSGSSGINDGRRGSCFSASRLSNACSTCDSGTRPI